MLREWIAKAQGRSPKWPAAREAFLKANPKCACCGKPARVAHHIVPFHVEPERELDPANLLAFCGKRCHFAFGHLFNWSSWNPQTLYDCAWMRTKIETRPRCLPRPTFWSRLRSAFNLLLATSSLLILCACAGPNPTQARVALLCWYAPRITVYAAEPATNGAPAEVSSRSDGDSNALTARASQRGGVAVILDNQLAFPVGSGSAASNSVFSGIEIPLVK